MINSQSIKYTHNSNLILIFIISIIFFLIRWGTSFYYLNEEIITKVIFESIDDGAFFYPLIKNLSILEFNSSLNPFINDLKVMPLPFGSILLHTIFYKFLNIYGLILVDLIGIFLFLLIFYKIFLTFNKPYISIFLSVIMFSLPILLSIFFKDFNFIPINQFKDFFTLRVHRPFPANLFMFLFVYIILIMSQTEVFKEKYFVFLGIIMGLTFSSFYYFFSIQILTIIFFIIYKFKKNCIKKIFQNYKSLILLIISFFLISSPFIFVLLFHENDLTLAAGVFDLTIDKKLTLLKYYLFKIISLKFILFNLIILIFSIYINKNKIKNYRILNIFNIIYASSVIAPILFVLISNKSGILYHFNNNIVIFAFLSLGVSLLLILSNLIHKISKPIIIYAFLFFVSLTYILNEIDKKKDINHLRNEFNQIANTIHQKKFDNKLNTLLTFDDKFMIWASLSNRIQYLNLTYVGLTAKNFETIENDLIEAFRFLNLNSNDFLKFLENKKQNWRLFNPNTANFFSLRYSANSLNTFNNSKNFPKKLKEIIFKSSPMYSQQIAIPNDEFLRLKEKFIKNKKNEILPKPEIIILNKNLDLIKNVKIDSNQYCKIFDGEFYILFFLMSERTECIN